MSNRRVALVTSSALPALHEDDLLLAAALEARGVRAVPAVWSDPEVAWGTFDALVIRSPWDYYERPTQFRSWLDACVENGVRTCNGADILRWNFDKRYLQDLAAAGVAVVPTVWVAQGAAADVAGLARARGWDEVVVKPTISGGAWRTWRFRIDDAPTFATDLATTLLDRGVLVQPYLPEIQDGELSLLFFDGVFSHAVRKRPKAGDYRVQVQFGGTTEAVEADPAWIEQARRCALAAPSLPVYARVDGVVVGGRFVLMELEVFEPRMFLRQHPDAPDRFARAVVGRLG